MDPIRQPKTTFITKLYYFFVTQIAIEQKLQGMNEGGGGGGGGGERRFTEQVDQETLDFTVS